MLRMWTAIAAAALLCCLVLPVGRAEEKSKAAPVALEGNCAVCYAKAGKWVPGKSDHAVMFDGHKYLFPSDAEKKAFVESPAEFVPVLNGDCVVCLVNAGVRVPGKIEHAVRHEGRIYLFPGNKEKKAFEAKPEKFMTADIAANGHCVVCRVMDDKDVQGKPEFTAHYGGMRYFFTSDQERQMFLETPEKFVVSVKGKTDCAACAYGVHPIGAPGIMGLAVKAGDNQVFVIEGAHKLYPEVYESRFDGLPVTVVGTPIRQKGEIIWIQPTYLMRDK